MSERFVFIAAATAAAAASNAAAAASAAAAAAAALLLPLESRMLCFESLPVETHRSFSFFFGLDCNDDGLGVLREVRVEARRC